MRILNFSLLMIFIMVLLILPANAKLGFVGIGVSDIDNSTKFYQDILGLDIIGTYGIND